MTSLRKSLGFLMAVMLATFAGSSIAAQTKTFYAFVQPLTPTSVSITFCNNSPGPSTINSIKIAEASFGNTALVDITNVSGPGTAVEDPTDGSWIINGFTGIKRNACGAPWTITFTSISGSGCQQGKWGAFANAGNAYPQGDELQLD